MIGQTNGKQEQLDRIHRLRASLNDYLVNQKVYEDNMWAFFQATHHFKDWIAACHPTLSADVESYINGSPYLSVAADLANRSKHMTLKKPRGGNADINRNNVTVILAPTQMNLSQSGGSVPIQENHSPAAFWEYFIDIPSGPSYYHIDLADNVLREWNAYLTTRGI